MALESCKVLILSFSFKAYHFSIREGKKKTSGWVEWKQAFPKILSERLIFDVNLFNTTDLMPINLVMFNNETETKE